MRNADWRRLTLVMSSLPLERVYIGACFHLVLIVGNLTAQSTGNYRGIGSGIKN